jgi:AhpD family alkylhydroperoxidase
VSIRERLLLRQVRHVQPDLDDPRTSAVTQQIRRDLGMIVPPYLLQLPAPDALRASWVILREPSYGRRVDRAAKEAVAAAVSATNACPYCVDVHTTTLHTLGDRRTAAAIGSGRTERIADPTLRAVVTWALATRAPDAPILRRRPFPDQQAPELIGVVLAYQYINRMVNIFAAESPFPARPRRAGWILREVASRALPQLASSTGRPGGSLDLLPPAPLPDDLAWARGDPIIADAFGRATAAFESLGQRFVPEPVRGLVTRRLTEWRGEEPGMSRAWVDSAIEVLPPSQRPYGRLALLAALASYQVDAGVIAAARTRPGARGDEVLLSTAAWASFAAARRVGSWLWTRVDARGAVA